MDKIKVGILVFCIGSIGIVSLLSIDISEDLLPREVLKEFSMSQLKLLILINPFILLTISVLVGTLLYKKMHFKLPIIESIVLDKRMNNVNYKKIFLYGFIYSTISSIIVFIIIFLLKPYILNQYLLLEKSIKFSYFSRFTYGGITEEIFLRFGLMTFLLWLIFLIKKSLKTIYYWISIFITAIIFSIGHLPIVFTTIENPSIYMIIYIVSGNLIYGISFGYLYWKKGLESAIIGHIISHVYITLIE